jgi:hypothetical protein
MSDMKFGKLILISYEGRFWVRKDELLEALRLLPSLVLRVRRLLGSYGNIYSV